MNSAHMVILERTDSRKLSGSGRGRVSFQNGRKHIVLSFLTDLQLVTEAGREGTESREPHDKPARSPPAQRQTAGEKNETTDLRRTTTKKPGCNAHPFEPRPGPSYGPPSHEDIRKARSNAHRGPIGAQRPAPFPTGRAGDGVDTRPLEPHPDVSTGHRTPRTKKKPQEAVPPGALRGGGYLLSHPG